LSSSGRKGRNWIICKAFTGNRVSKAVSRVAVAVKGKIGSFVRHSAEVAELVGP
jgi:hypothetical protein